MDDSVYPLPIVYNQHGQLLDPYSGNPLEEGQEGPDSIFYVPLSSPHRPNYVLFAGDDGSPIEFPEVMRKLRETGFEGSTVGVFTTPKPEDRDRVPAPPPLQLDETTSAGVEIVRGNFYRGKCNYCWAVVQSEEREWGFTLREIRQAADNGCSTCGVLYAGITHFADLIFHKYECGRVRVRQGNNGGRPIQLKQLSEIGVVTACFDEFGGETIALSWRVSGKFAMTAIQRLPKPLTCD
jgi:hypothetical protein